MRLIDADALLKEDFTERFIDFYDNTVFETIIESAPTVDIKTEVAREIFDKVIDMISFRYLNEDDYTFGELIYGLNELKNKYTKEGVDK